MRVLEDLEWYAHSLKDAGVALANVRETRANLQRLIDKMDALEADMDRITERSHTPIMPFPFIARRWIEGEKADYESTFDEERRALKTEIVHLKELLRTSSGEHEHVERLKGELRQARAQIETWATARRAMEDRHGDILSNVGRQRQELSDALSEATNRTKAADVLWQQLSQAREEAEEVRALETRNAARITKLLEVHDETVRDLEQVRARGENLEAHIDSMSNERSEMKQALKEASEGKDRRLRPQASEHHRRLRDYVTDGDGDRAVLGHQFVNPKAEERKKATAQAEMKGNDGVGPQKELQRVERELQDARHVKRVKSRIALRGDVKAGRVSQWVVENKLEEAEHLIAQLLETSIAYRTAHFKALTLAQVAIYHPSLSKSVRQLNDSYTILAKCQLEARFQRPIGRTTTR